MLGMCQDDAKSAERNNSVAISADGNNVVFACSTHTDGPEGPGNTKTMSWRSSRYKWQ